MPTKQKQNEFLTLHNREVKPFVKALTPVLQQQRLKVVSRFRELMKTRTVIEPQDSALLYPWGMMADVQKTGNQQIERGMIVGAKSELSQVRRLAKRAVSLPLEVQEQISDAIDAQFNSWFWEHNFGDATRRRISNALFQAATEGFTLQETVELLRLDRFGIFSKVRAERIARTELTGALNGGAWIARQEAIDEGAIVGEEWNAILDDRTRNKHRQAHGQVSERDSIGVWYVRDANGYTLAEGREFVLGTERARYPGDPNLSAGNRIYCRCTTNAVV